MVQLLAFGAICFHDHSDLLWFAFIYFLEIWESGEMVGSVFASALLIALCIIQIHVFIPRREILLRYC